MSYSKCNCREAAGLEKLRPQSGNSMLDTADKRDSKDQLSSDEDTEAAPEKDDMSDSGRSTGASGIGASSDRLQGKPSRTPYVLHADPHAKDFCRLQQLGLTFLTQENIINYLE